jgi:hypothetical protein
MKEIRCKRAKAKKTKPSRSRKIINIKDGSSSSVVAIFILLE